MHLRTISRTAVRIISGEAATQKELMAAIERALTQELEWRVIE
jgi:hypothetical protein